MRTTLAAVSMTTVLATAYLTASMLALRPPRANYQQWAVIASLIAAQGALTLAALFNLSGWGRGLRYPVLAGAVAIALAGAMWVSSTLSGPHFEAYALVLGSMLVVQGVLTLLGV
jgi:hypothetical protein